MLVALALGRSQQDIATELGISRSKVARYDRSAKRIGASVPAAAAPPVPAPCAAVEPSVQPADLKIPGDSATHAPAERAAQTSEAAPPVADSDTLRVLVELQREQIRLMRESREVGNLSAAQKFGRDAAGLSNTIARMQKLGQEDADILRISRADIAAARLSFEEKLRALADRPLLCAHCGRALSVEWGEGK